MNVRVTNGAEGLARRAFTVAEVWRMVESGVLKPGDTYAITCGEPMGYPGGTNMLKVVRVG